MDGGCGLAFPMLGARGIRRCSGAASDEPRCMPRDGWTKVRGGRLANHVGMKRREGDLLQDL